jgi:L-lactate dehydrogenase complex protein LldF
MEHLTAETFDQNARNALSDPVLHGALRHLADNFAERRKVAMASVDDWEGLREKARAIKQETLLHLDTYLLQFVEKAENGGVQFHWARDGKEACQIVLDLVRARGAKMVVKSKSMATEEIHLNDALGENGIEPIETDLGEWIIQLAADPVAYCCSGHS